MNELQLKTLSEGMERLRHKLAERKEVGTARRYVEVRPPPRYDDVYFAGLAWLDTLADTDDWGEL